MDDVIARPKFIVADAGDARVYDLTPQLGNPAEDRWLRTQFRWEDIEHRIKTGQILDLVYDTETTDLNPMFAALTQFSGKIVTLDGRIVDKIKLDIQVPEDVAISPQAAIVTQSSPKALYSPQGRIPPHIAAGKIMLFFRNPYRKLWDLLADQSIMITNAKGREEEVRVYTIASPDGTKKAEIRLHKGGRFVSFRYPEEERLPDGAVTYRDMDGARWKRVAAPAFTEGHNIRRFDDRILWATLHRTMSDEIFLTHTRKFQRFRVDTLDLAKLVSLLDDGSENGFKPGIKIDAATGRPYRSFTLSSLMEANTRDAVPERGIDAGVRMPDGSKYDRRRAHADAAYDVDATMALKAYVRKRAPAVVRMVEENSDFYQIKRFLMGGEGFEMHPIRAFARSIHPDKASLHLGVCVNSNEEIEERRQAVIIRTDTDQMLEDYTYDINGERKKLLDMSVEELAAMLKGQRGKADALCEVIDLRKNPPVVLANMAFHRGICGDPERHEANRRFVLAHEAFREKLQKAHSMAMPSMPDWTTIRNPQAEEHLYTRLAAPKRYEFDIDGKKVLLNETVHAEWVKVLRRNRNIDAVLCRAIKPQTVELEVREDSLEAFIERMKTVDNHLLKFLGTSHTALHTYDPSLSPDDADDAHAASASGTNPYKVLPPPDRSFTPPKWDYIPNPEKEGKSLRVRHVLTREECTEFTANAIEYLWKLRAELMYEFHDNSTRFTVQDRHGHTIPFPRLNRMKQGDLADCLRTGEYNIVPEELDWSAELIAKMFRDAGRVAWVKHYFAAQGRDEEVRQWETWEKYFTAKRALSFHGAPHEDPDQKRWMTPIKGLKEVARIEHNLRSDDIRADEDEWGQHDIYMRNSAMAGPILNECKKLFPQQLRQNPLTDEHLHLLGYDPQTGLPIEHAPYTIPAEAMTLAIDVPDRMLESPLRHPDVASNILMLNPGAAQRRALEEARPGTHLFLRGEQTGRLYYAAKAVVLSPNEIAPSPYFQEVYAAAATRYGDSGVTPPNPEQFIPLAVESLERVPARVDPAAQPIKVPRWEHFMATVSQALGYRDTKLTGLAIKDEGVAFSSGPARLQGMVQNDHKPGQTESGEEVPTTITQVRTLTLKQAQERIETGQRQGKAAGALEADSIDTLRSILSTDSITEADVRANPTLKKLEISSLPSLRRLMQRESFTHRDALHYGYAGLKDMRSTLTKLFTDQELETGRDDNRIHFITIEPAKKMTWHQPARRAMVRLDKNLDDDAPPPSPPVTELPPATPSKAGSWRENVRQRQGAPRRRA